MLTGPDPFSLPKCKQKKRSGYAELMLVVVLDQSVKLCRVVTAVALIKIASNSSHYPELIIALK